TKRTRISARPEAPGQERQRLRCVARAWSMLRLRGLWAGFLGLASALVLMHSAGPAAAGPLGWLIHHEEPPPCTLAAIGAALDAADRDIRAAGTIVIKQPDVWGQDRMTAFRRDFDLRMRGELDRFQPVISAQVARTEAAVIVAQGLLGARLSPGS